MGRILIADDHDAVRRGLARGLTEAGHEVQEASNGNAAIEQLHDSYFDVVLSDLRMGGSDGMDVLRTTRALHPTTAVILMTAFGSVNTAVEAMKIGAFDYVQKPFEIEEMEVKIEKALEVKRLKHELEYLRGTQQDIYEFDRIVGSSPALQSVLDIVKKVAKSNTTVLIRGETGTGKELIAGAIHHNSLRNARNFVKVNCAALQENLLESELFGHEKGAFTGADKQRIGRFEQADGGTLFLDEIGDMSPSTQAKILRVLQEHEFERLGGTRTLRVDVRLIAATNRDLSAMVQTGQFREDLYYRLNVVGDRDAAAARAQGRHRAAGELVHPPVLRRAEEEDRRARARGAEAADALQLAGQHPRAPEHHRAGDAAGRRPGPRRRRSPPRRDSDARRAAATTPRSSRFRRPAFPLEDIERHALIEALKMSNWVQKDAAELLSISPRVMNYKIKTLGIEFPEADGAPRRSPSAAGATHRGRQLAGVQASGCPAPAGLARSPHSFSALRVRLLVDVEQLRRVDVGVALGGAQPGVAEQLLDGPEIGAALQQVRRERMAQRVRADAGPLRAVRDVAPHQPIDAAAAQAGAAIVHEQRIAVPP